MATAPLGAPARWALLLQPPTFAIVSRPPAVSQFDAHRGAGCSLALIRATAVGDPLLEPSSDHQRHALCRSLILHPLRSYHLLPLLPSWPPLPAGADS